MRPKILIMYPNPLQERRNVNYLYRVEMEVLSKRSTLEETDFMIEPPQTHRLRICSSLLIEWNLNIITTSI